MQTKLKLLIISLLSALVINCSTDDTYKAETEFKFPFSVELTKDKSYYAQEQGNLKIVPSLDIENEEVRLDYYFTIETDNSDMSVYYKNELIKSKEQYLLKEDNLLQFKFNKTGVHTVTIKFENQYGFILEKKETFNVTDIDFYVFLNTEDKVFPKIAKDLVLDIKAKEETEKEIKYKVSLELENLPLSEGKVDITYNGKKIALKEEFTYTNSEIKINFPSAGDYEFNITATSSQGKIVIKKQIIKVEDVKFNFDLKNSSKIYPVDKNLFKIIPENLEEDILQKYTIKYNVTSGTEPQFIYNNTTLAKNTAYAVSGEDIYLIFPKTGIYNIKVTLENQYGYILEKEFAFDVNHANFDINITNLPKEIFIKNEYLLKVEPILQNEEEGDLNYTFKVNTNGNTKVYYNDRLLNNDVYTKYNSSQIKVVFDKAETANIEFVFKNSQGLEVSKKQPFEVVIADFDLDIIKEEKYLPNIKTPLNFVLTDKSNLKNIDYTFNIVASTPGIKLYYNNSVISKDVSHKYIDKANLEVQFEKEGTYELTISAKNSHEKTVSKKVIIQVNPVLFNVEITAEGKIYPNEQKHLTFKIESENAEDQSYTFSYLVKSGPDKPTVNYNGYLLTQNQKTNYVGQDLFITFPKVGIYEIEYSIKNNYGTEIKKIINYDINYANFEIEVKDIPAKPYIQTKYTLNIAPTNLEENSNNQKYSLKIEGSPAVKAYYKGYQISLNNYVDYTESKIDLEFSEPIGQEVVFYLKNSQGLEVSKKIIFNPTIAGYELDITKAKEYLPNTRENLSVKVKNNSELDNITYKFNVTYPQEVKMFYNGSAIASGAQIDYKNENLQLEVTKTGTYELNFNFINSQGQKESKLVVIEVTAVSFDYSISYEGDINPNEKKTALFKLDKGDKVNQTNTFSYIVKSGPSKPAIEYNGNIILENNDIAYTTENIHFTFPSIGVYIIEFSAKNNFGTVINKSVTFNVVYSNFEVIVENIPTDIFIGTKYPINVFPKADLNSPTNHKYTLKIEGNPSIKAYYKGYQIPLNNYVDYDQKEILVEFTEPGQHDINFVLKNSQGLEVSKKAIFTSGVATFDISLTKEEKYLANKRGKIFIKIGDKSNLGNLNYKFSTTFPQEVKMYYEGSQIISNMSVDFKTDHIEFDATEPGDYEINFQFENSQGHKVSQRLPIKVLPVEFNYNVNVEGNLYPNEEKNFSIDLIASSEEKQTYKLKYVAKGNKPIITYNGNTLYENDYIAFENPNMAILLKDTGNYDVEFTLQNQFGYEVTKLHKFAVSNLGFEIDIKNVEDKILPKKSTPFQIKPILNNVVDNVSYTYSIKLDKPNVQIMNNKTSVIENYTYEYKNENFDFTFPAAGTYILTVDMKNNFGGSISKAYQVKVLETDFTLKINEKNPIYIGETSPIDIDITSDIPGSTYKIKYVFQGGSGEVIDVKQDNSYLYADTYIDYKKSPFMITYPRNGQYILIITAMDNFGKEKEVKKQIIVNDKSFTANITANKTQLEVGQSAIVNLDIKKTPENQKIYLKILNTGGDNATFKYNNNDVNFNEEFEVSNSSKLSILFNSIGTNNFTFEFRNDSGKKETKNLSFTIKDLDYNTTLSWSILDKPINGYDRDFYYNGVNLKLNITSLATANRLKIKFVNSGLITVNGLSANDYHNVTALSDNYSFDFDKSVLGNERNSIQVVILEPNGNEVSTTINLPIHRDPEQMQFDEAIVKKIVTYDQWKASKGYKLEKILFDDFVVYSEIPIISGKIYIGIWHNEVLKYNVPAQITAQGVNNYRISFNNITVGERQRNNDDVESVIKLELTDKLGRTTRLNWQQNIK